MKTSTFGFLSMLLFVVQANSRALSVESTSGLSARSNSQSPSTSSSSASKNIPYSLVDSSAVVTVMNSRGGELVAITEAVATADQVFAGLTSPGRFYSSSIAFNLSDSGTPPTRNMCNISNVPLATLDMISVFGQFLAVENTKPGPAGLSGSVVAFSTGGSNSSGSEIGPTGLNRTIADEMLQYESLVETLGLQAVAEMITNGSPAICVGLGPTVGTDTASGAQFGYLATLLIVNTCIPVPLPPYSTDGFSEQVIASMLQTCATNQV